MNDNNNDLITSHADDDRGSRLTECVDGKLVDYYKIYRYYTGDLLRELGSSFADRDVFQGSKCEILGYNHSQVDRSLLNLHR